MWNRRRLRSPTGPRLSRQVSCQAFGCIHVKCASHSHNAGTSFDTAEVVATVSLADRSKMRDADC
jgi:hypothetical protein